MTEVSPDTKPSVPAEPCPDCQTPRAGSDRFCESCGYNFATGESSASRPAARSTSATSATAPWEALVEADREYFERVAGEEIDFPSHYPPRRFVLEEPQIGIGRHSPRRGTRPQIDLSGAPEDPAISHLHAILLRQDDGSYAVMDPGSSNGTTLNDDPTPIAPNKPVVLADGDRIHLGAWTTMTIRNGEDDIDRQLDELGALSAVEDEMARIKAELHPLASSAQIPAHSKAPPA